MNTSAETFLSVYTSQKINNQIHSYQSCGSQWVDFKLPIFLHKLSLFISKVNINANGLDLVVSLAFSNGERLNIPQPYQQTFLQKVNEGSKKIVYQSFQETHRLKLICRLPQKLERNAQKIISYFFQLIKEDEEQLENALCDIGIIKGKGKKYLNQKKEELRLKKTVFTEIKKNKNDEKKIISKAPSSSIFNAKKIVQINDQKNEEKSKKGGYFEVKKIQCTVFDTLGNEKSQNLACKTMRKNKIADVSSMPKLDKQICLASKIIDSTHFVKYYVQQNENVNGNRQKLYMQYIPDLLKERLYKSSVSFENLIELSLQLIKGVQIMHQSGIVHRDLKPENILISQKQGKMTLKIIDFGESALIQSEFDKKACLGCTLPYSPIQCMSRTEIGFNKPQIDLWSVSMILYEMAFRSLPMFYSRCLGPQIVDQWRNKKNFSIFPLYRKRRGCRKVQQIISILSIAGLQVDQEERLNIGCLKKVFEAIKKTFA